MSENQIKYREKEIDKSKKKIKKYEKERDRKFPNNRIRKNMFQEKIDKENEVIEMHERLMETPVSEEAFHQELVDNSKWTKAANQFESVGDSMQNAGRSTMKAGLHVTGAVWTPLIYLGYQGIKHARKKPKNESVEQDLIELIKEVEQAHKDGKITEEQKRGFIIDFVDNYYKQ